MNPGIRGVLSASLALLAASAGHARAADWLSHEPMRPLPAPVDGGAVIAPIVVDAAAGDDAAAGTAEAPWRTIARATRDAKPGDTICLRGGVYYETVTLDRSGTAERPITIRSLPGQLAVLDAGYREFLERPADAWEPGPGSASGEYRSVRTYPELGVPHDPLYPVLGSGENDEAVRATGLFGDSLIPLHGYAFRGDLLSTNEYWNLARNTEEDPLGFYCGPGVWFDAATARIHVRLAHHRLPVFGARGSYRGETDPRRLPLVIGGPGIALHIAGASHVRIRDLVIRGTRNRAIQVESATNVEFSGVWVFGGCPGLYAEHTAGLRMTDCAFRGAAAPWSSRASMKYRGISPYLLLASGAEPPNRDFEFTRCEFTDSHDGARIGAIDGVSLHDCLVDNINDDGLYVTYDGHPGREVRIYRNLIGRCLSSLALSGSGAGQTGTSLWVYRNVFDMRGPVPYALPRTPQDPQELRSRGRTCGDHGSPVWKPLFFYHNTVLLDETQWRDYYGGALAKGTAGTVRRILNNVFYHAHGRPGLNLGPTSGVDLVADGNLHWSAESGESLADAFLPKFRASPAFEASKAGYPPGWTSHDIYADPRFAALAADWAVLPDVRPAPGSPALDAGVDIPAEWPDVLREPDAGRPDIGALPVGAGSWRVGMRGRIELVAAP